MNQVLQPHQVEIYDAERYAEDEMIGISYFGDDGPTCLEFRNENRERRRRENEAAGLG